MDKKLKIFPEHFFQNHFSPRKNIFLHPIFFVHLGVCLYSLENTSRASPKSLGRCYKHSPQKWLKKKTLWFKIEHQLAGAILKSCTCTVRSTRKHRVQTVFQQFLAFLEKKHNPSQKSYIVVKGITLTGYHLCNAALYVLPFASTHHTSAVVI